jgi:hypothetical protein
MGAVFEVAGAVATERESAFEGTWFLKVGRRERRRERQVAQSILGGAWEDSS